MPLVTYITRSWWYWVTLEYLYRDVSCHRAKGTPLKHSQYPTSAFEIKDTSKGARIEVSESGVYVVSYEAQESKGSMPTPEAMTLNAMLLPDLFEKQTPENGLVPLMHQQYATGPLGYRPV